MSLRITSVFIALAAAIVIWFSACRSGAGSEDKVPKQISYNFNIRPILSDKCFKCHGPDAAKREAGLRLDIPDSAFAPLRETKGAFALVPGKPEASELFKRIASADTSFQMPPPNAHLGALSPLEVALIKKWIEQGARYETHWAFIPPQKTAPPEVPDKTWNRTEIDRFVYAKMKTRGLEPNPEAEKERLLKRAALDITGLTPTTETMDRFLADRSDKAFENLVDELLGSPHYGERMALHWLDLARYADSYGYQDDNIRTQWPWRDWVIHAFNTNQRYDSFLTWQIAGDMLPEAGKEKTLATAFFRNHKYTEEGGVIDEEYRMEYLIDKTKTYSKGLLGLTVECAQCHDHKYDPFSQKDYYSLLAFFNNTREIGYEGDVAVSKPAKTPILAITDGDIKNMLAFINKKDTGQLMVSVMGERDTLRKTFVLNRGVYSQPGAEVQAAALPAVMKFDEQTYPRNRLGLAAWTISRSNPLTARVFINRLWQEIFGRGLVKTAGDFGMQGELPSHPELLDWLAVDFMESGWDVKRMIKKMLMTATYRQSAQCPEEKLKQDPENLFLARAPRIRVNAEFIRDLVLASSGLLNRAIGGPSVKPYQPKGLWEAATSGRGALATYRTDEGDALYRRGVYTFIKLTVPPPSLGIFDASNRDQCEVQRLNTNTPLQALVMMNDPVVLEASRVFAQQLCSENTKPEDQLRTAFRRILCRQPGEKEWKILNAYYREQLTLYQQHKLDAAETLNVGEYPKKPATDINRQAALMKTIHTIYNLEEAITKT